MRRNELVDATLDELAKHGVAEPSIWKTSNHIKIRFMWHGKERLVVVGSTSSDRRAAENCRSTVRHVLGIERAPTKGRRRAQKQRNRVDVAHLPETFTAGRDPWAAFAIERDCLNAFPTDKAFALLVAQSCRRIEAAGKAAAERIAELI